jgi:nicotinate-nucleotide adenylyltransferase
LKTIGILGGTFDPIHKGHLQVAEQTFSQLGLDELHFLPCATPVHRDLPRASDADRLQMIKLAIADHAGFKLNTLELVRGGRSYTIDSLRQIFEQGQYDSIYLVLGADAFKQFRSWKSPDEILQLVNLVVCRRPGVELDWSNNSSDLVDSVQALKGTRHGAILPLDIDENSCSSSLIKQQLQSSASAQTLDCLPEAVQQYIMSNHLYE